MSDLASLMQVAPGSAAFMMGQNNTQARQSEALRQQELQQIIQQRIAEMQQAEQMNPLKLEKARLEAQGLAAGLPGITANSELLGQKARLGAATLDSDIEADKAKRSAEAAANRAKEIREKGKSIVDMAPFLEGVPTGLGQRHIALAQRFKELGLPDNHPLARQFAGVPEDKLPSALSAIGRKMVEQGDQYIREIDREKLQQEGSTKREGMRNAAQLALEEKRIAAGKYNRNRTAATVADKLLRADSPTKKAEILETAYYEAMDAGDEAAAKKYAARAVEARQRVAEDARNRGLATPRPDVEAATKGRVQNTPAPSATAPIAGQGGAAPAGNAQVAPPAAVAKLRSNPALAAAFDEKYGKGAAAKALGQ